MQIGSNWHSIRTGTGKKVSKVGLPFCYAATAAYSDTPRILYSTRKLSKPSKLDAMPQNRLYGCLLWGSEVQNNLKTLTRYITAHRISERRNYRSPWLPVRLLSSLPARSMMYSLPNRRRWTAPVSASVNVLQTLISRILWLRELCAFRAVAAVLL